MTFSSQAFASALEDCVNKPRVKVVALCPFSNSCSCLMKFLEDIFDFFRHLKIVQITILIN